MDHTAACTTFTIHQLHFEASMFPVEHRIKDFGNIQTQRRPVVKIAGTDNGDTDARPLQAFEGSQVFRALLKCVINAAVELTA